MSTVIGAPLVRSVGPDSFADLTGPDVPVTFLPNGLSFDADLDEPTVAAIRARMTSRDDADEAQRRNLAALRDAVASDPSLENVATLATATAAYVLGES